jgi:hypothetical protein
MEMYGFSKCILGLALKVLQMQVGCQHLKHAIFNELNASEGKN